MTGPPLFFAAAFPRNIFRGIFAKGREYDMDKDGH